MTMTCAFASHSTTRRSSGSIRTHSLWKMPFINAWKGFGLGALSGFLTGSLMIPFWGTAFGLIIGAGVGLVLGFLLGFITAIGLVAKPHASVKQARGFVVALSIVGGIAVAIVVPALLTLPLFAFYSVVQAVMATVLGGLQTLTELSAKWQRTELNEGWWVRLVQLKYLVFVSIFIGATFIPLSTLDGNFINWITGNQILSEQG